MYELLILNSLLDENNQIKGSKEGIVNLRPTVTAYESHAK